MADFLKPLGLAALVALATPALAQEAGDATATDEAAAPAEAAPAETAPAASEDAAARAPTYIDETFGDWSRECVRRPEGSEGADPCLMSQILKDDNGRTFGRFSVRVLPAGSAATAQADIFVALELVPYLPAGVTLGVDSGLSKEYSYLFCTPATGCLVQPNLSTADIDAFKAGDVLNMGFAIVTPGNKLAGITSPVSLKGFTAAWESIETQASVAAPTAAPTEAPTAAPAE